MPTQNLRPEFPSSNALFPRPKARGKFLFVGDEKFYVKGTTYGAFPPNREGHQFPEEPCLENDLTLMKQAGINTIMTYTVPPASLLDRAQEHGIRVIVNIPWMGHVCFLEDRRSREKVRKEVQSAIRSLHRHPAVLMQCIGKELPPQIVRWHGPKRVQAFLQDLYHTAKDENPESLVSYTSFPTTEYLELPFVDVFTFNVYLHNRPEFSSYLARLQNLAGERPLVLTEFGVCSFRHGETGQAGFIDWQLEEAFDQGLAGAVVFGWTDPFYQDNMLVEEWGFGLVDANRNPKPSYEVAKHWFTRDTPFPPDRKWPRISVVVATYNGAATLDGCLQSLCKLRYSDYEVIVVNDGSTDDTAAIMERFPVRGITTENGGVSAARNVGMRAATGEIVAYIDADAYADPDWLSYLATTYLTSGVVAVGGPNLVPAEDGWIAKCVYRSPGGPCQVMMDDRSAEHIPGCNMSFCKRVLEEVDGFDPMYRAAGDDVDVCWRVLERGYQIGFSPSAVVWHHRRPSIRAYWKQQVGYGVSESLLERKHPNKFNPWGHTFWAGRIYGPYPFFRLFPKPVIYHGLWGSAGFQPMYEKGGANMLAFLPRAMEWHFALTILMGVGFFFPWAFALAGLGVLYTLIYAISCGRRANLDVLLETDPSPSWGCRFKWRAVIVLLHLAEPAARDWGRLKGGLTPWRSVVKGSAQKQRGSHWWERLQPFRRVVRWTRKGTDELEKFQVLDRITKKLRVRSVSVRWNPQTAAWDLRVGRGALAEAWCRVVVEHHGGPHRLVRLSAKIVPQRFVLWAKPIVGTAGALMALTGHYAAAVFLLSLFLVLWVAPTVEASRLEGLLIEAAEEVASELFQEKQRPAEEAAHA